MIDEAELAKWCSKATPGDWTWREREGGFTISTLLGAVALVYDSGARNVGVLDDEGEANARLIAAARTAIPALLTQLAAQRIAEAAVRKAAVVAFADEVNKLTKELADEKAEHARVKAILDEAVAFEVAQRPSPILTVMLERDKLYHSAVRKLDEAVSAMRLRSIFIGHPGEPFYMDGAHKVFHWKPEYELAEAAQALAKDLLK